jgi:hypothetical protein
MSQWRSFAPLCRFLLFDHPQLRAVRLTAARSHDLHMTASGARSLLATTEIWTANTPSGARIWLIHIKILFLLRNLIVLYNYIRRAV